MNAKQLLAMASRRQWIEASTLLMRPENHSLASELMPQLEELGDRSVASRSWTDAANHYQAALLCATLRKHDPDMHTPLFRIGGKLNDSMRQFMEEHIRDASGPIDWDAGTSRAIELANMRRLQEAEAMLRRLGQLDDRGHEGSAACGRRLEEAAAELRGRQKDLVKWFREQALAQFKKAESAADIGRLQTMLAPPPPVRKPPPAPPPPPPVDFERLVGELTGFALDFRRGDWMRVLRAPEHQPFASRIAERFEAIGDTCRGKREWIAAEFYTIASMACRLAGDNAERLVEKIRHATFAGVDEKLSHPRDLGDGSDLAESLALAGRFNDADELLMKLEPVPPGRFELIGDYLAPRHPELARWFYENISPAEAVAQKLLDVTARVPRRVATIQVALSAVGQGPRPEPELSTETIENGQLLKLVPNGKLYTRRPCTGGSEPVPPEALHRYYFRVRIESRELRLYPEPDEYGRMLPFACEPPPLRLKIGKPLRIAYNVPGGGPAWTLTLISASEAAPENYRAPPCSPSPS